jgi:hypothetical protein
MDGRLQAFSFFDIFPTHFRCTLKAVIIQRRLKRGFCMISTVSHRGKTILIAKMTGRHEQVKATMDEVDRYLESKPKGSVLVLLDWSDLKYSPEIVELTKGKAAELTSSVFKAMAIVGTEGLKQVIYRSAQKVAKVPQPPVFESVEEAKDWLATR